MIVCRQEQVLNPLYTYFFKNADTTSLCVLRDRLTNNLCIALCITDPGTGQLELSQGVSRLCAKVIVSISNFASVEMLNQTCVAGPAYQVGGGLKQAVAILLA